MTINFRLGIATVLRQIAAASQEECVAEAAFIHPSDRARAERFACSIGGWERFNDAFPLLLANAAEKERYGLLGSQMRLTLIGNSLIAREHGVVLMVQRPM